MSGTRVQIVRLRESLSGFLGCLRCARWQGGYGIILLHLSHYSGGLTMATYILDNILGVLIKSVLPFLELMVTEKDPEALTRNTFKYEVGSETQRLDVGNIGIRKLVGSTLKKNMPFRIFTLVILAADICTIVGASSINSSGSGRSSSMEAGSILFLVTIILMVLIVWGHHLSNAHRTTAKILLASGAFFIVRHVYSILSSLAGINFENPSKFLLIFGEYQYYTFMGFMEECIISIILLVNLYVFHTYRVLR